MHSILQAWMEAFSLPCLTSSCLNSVGLGLVAFVSLYVYSTWTYNTFSSQGIPGPKPLPLIGNALDLLRKDPATWQMDFATKYGKIYGLYLGRRPILVVADPEIIKDVTVKQFNRFTNRATLRPLSGKPFNLFLISLVDDHWKHVRAAISPVFTTGKLKEMTATINDCTDSLATRVAQNDGRDMDVKEVTSSFALDTVAGTAFGLDVRSLDNRESQFLAYARKAFAFTNERSLKVTLIMAISMLSDTMSKALGKLGLTMMAAELAYFRGVVQPLFKRDDYKEGRRNFVQLCRDQLVKLESVPKDSLRTTDGITWTTAGLLAEEVEANAIIFLLAGYETTSSLLTMFFYAMAKHPRVQEKLSNDLRISIGRKTSLSYDDVKDLEYLDWCIDETLRMYPPTPRFDRECGTASQVGGVNVTAGMGVIFPVYAIHHDPTYWPEPDVFRPERFSPDECRSRPATAHIPFGYGPRICIGMRLAKLEAKVAISKVLTTYTVRPGIGTEEIESTSGRILIQICQRYVNSRFVGVQVLTFFYEGCTFEVEKRDTSYGS